MIALVLALSVAAAPPKLPRASVERLADGAELVLLPIAAPTASLRFVARSGASAIDPPGKEGLAHLLEHLVFHGSERIDEARVWSSARRAGATINAITTAELTTYQLDAPIESFAEAARDFISVVTSPALASADVGRERAVIQTERLLRGSLWIPMFVDGLLFGAANESPPVIGSRASRERVSLDDLFAAYATHYTPSNTTFVIVGDLEPDAARRLVLEASGAPPSLPEDTVVNAPASLSLPVRESAPAPISAVILGYELPRAGPACDDLGRLFELRLMRALVLGELASEVEAGCMILRGHVFLVGAAISRRFEGATLPDRMAAVATSLARSPPSSEERATCRRRAAGQRAALLGDTAKLADALALQLAAPRAPSDPPELSAVLGVPALDAAAMGKLARASITPEKELRVELTPFKR